MTSAAACTVLSRRAEPRIASSIRLSTRILVVLPSPFWHWASLSCSPRCRTRRQTGADHHRLRAPAGSSLIMVQGRMCTITKKQTASLAYLEQVRQHMSRLPSIDPTTRTLLVTGYPNVGKSSFMNSEPLRPSCTHLLLQQPGCVTAETAGVHAAQPSWKADVHACVAPAAACAPEAVQQAPRSSLRHESCQPQSLRIHACSPPSSPSACQAAHTCTQLHTHACSRLTKLLVSRRGHTSSLPARRAPACTQLHAQACSRLTQRLAWCRGHASRRGCPAVRVHHQVPVCGAPGPPLPPVAGHRHPWHPGQAPGGAQHHRDAGKLAVPSPASLLRLNRV